MPLRKFVHHIYPIDIITFAYIILTGIYIILGAAALDHITSHLFIRLILLGGIGSLIFFNYSFQNKGIHFLRNFYPLALLGYFYPETDYLNNIIFPNLDPALSNLELTVFGGQPSVWFSHYLPWKWFNELMNLSYFSFYIFIFVLCYWVYNYKRKHFQETIFIVCMSFYMYYILFILFPVAGPQFFLTPPDNQLPDAYFFRDLVKWVDAFGERPTAAFPSSHVGIMVILTYLAYKYAPKLLKWMIPGGILLVLSTIYIKAHYAIDVIAGFLTVPTMYWVSKYTFQLLTHGISHEAHTLTLYQKLLTAFHQLRSKTMKK
jgi:membrane-associated phospholipid phosphatase